MSETLVGRTEKYLRSSKTQVENAGLSENFVLLKKSAAVYTIVLAEGISRSAATELSEYVDTRVSRMPFFDSIKTSGDLDSWFAKNNQLDNRSRLYFDSLTRVSVSNKDISNQIGKALNLGNMLILQVDRWPCSNCASPLRIKLKLRAIDLRSGMIIWTGINELEVERPEDTEYGQLMLLSEELLTQFQKRFERKWHRKRYHNLSKLARS